MIELFVSLKGESWRYLKISETVGNPSPETASAEGASEIFVSISWNH